MDEEIEKPFPIEFIIILLFIAVANDIAEIFFDLLDFTGVGVAGEAIMEPINFVLDFFFTAIFWWKVGLGGGTITQYIGDILEPTFIPGRTISVALGMWVANNPNSAIGKVANTAASLESGNAEGALGEAESAAGSVEKETGTAQKKLEGENAGKKEISGGTEDKSIATEQISPDNQGAEENQNTPENDIFKNPYDNPVGTAQEEEFNPNEDAIQEGKGFSPTTREETEPEEHHQPQKVIDIASRRPPAAPKKEPGENADAESLAEAA